MSFIKEKELVIKNILKELNYDVDVVILPSSKKELGDFQLNIAMSIAKIYHKNPKDIAEEIVNKLPNTFCDINIANPGFINFKFSEDELINYFNEGLNNIENLYDKKEEKLIVLDYGGANAAKALHVGHMRSANIGEALNRLCKFLGLKTISDVHLGDLGRQAGMIISEIEIREPNLVFFDENYKGEYPQVNYTAKDLGEMYVRWGAGTNYGIKLVKNLSEDGKKNATSTNPYAYAVYKKGTRFTVYEFKDKDGGLWGRSPSGWICIKGASGTIYCKVSEE